MAIFYITKKKATKAGDDLGGDACRWYVTEQEARLSMRDGETIEEKTIDDVKARQYATMWLNMCEKNKASAIKREASKTAKERSDNMRKAWATRRKNLEH